MLHDPGHHRGLTVADGIHVNFHSVLQKLVDQDGVFRRDQQRFFHEGLQRFFIVHDFHGTPAQHVGRPHQHRIANTLGGLQCFLCVSCRVVIRLIQFEFGHNFLEAVAVFGPVNGIGRCSQDIYAGSFQAFGQIKRRLAAELHDHTFRFFRL